MLLGKMFKKNSELVLPLLFTVGGLFLLNSIFLFDFKPKTVIICCLLFTVIPHLIYTFRDNKWTYIGFAALLLGLAIYGHYTRDRLDEYELFVKDYGITFVAVPFYFILRSFKGRIAIGLLSFAGLIAAAMQEEMIAKAGPLMLIMFCICVFIEGVLRLKFRKREYKDEKYEGFVSSMIVLFAVVTLLIGTLNVSTKPLDWSWVRRVWESIEDTGEKIISSLEDKLQDGTEEDFSLPYASGELSEGEEYLIDEEHELIQVDSKQKMYKVIYLAADYLNEYTGKGFINTATSDDYLLGYTDSTLDYYETLYGIYRTGGFEEDATGFCNGHNLIRNRKMTITYVGFRGKNVFHTAKTWKFSLNEHSKDKMTYAGQQAKVVFLKYPDKRYAYDIQYYDLNLGSTKWKKFVDEASTYTYVDNSDINWNQVGKYWKLGLIDMEWRIPENLETILYERRNDIYREYMNIPDDIKDELTAFAEDITKDCETTYDKLLAIEKYLMDNYRFISGLTSTYEGDSVENFLFNTKEGGAPQFASAFALLSRCIGQPSRYCEGIAANMNGTKAEVSYALYGDDTHVWAESYIDGVGWVPFEMSPKYYSGRYLSWAVQELVNEDAAEPEPEPEEPVITEENMVEDVIDIVQINEKTISKEEHLRLYIFCGVMICFLAVLLLVSTIIFVKIFLNSSSYESSTDVAKIRLDMSQIMALLYDLAYKKEKYETISVFFDKASQMLPEKKEQMDEVLDSYLRFKYNDALLWPEEIAAMHKLRGELLQMEKKRMGIFAYIKMLMYKDK